MHFKSEFQILLWFSLLVHHGIELFLKDEIVHFGVILRIRKLKVSRVDGLHLEELSEKELDHFKKVNKVFLFLFVKKHVFSHLLEDLVDSLVLTIMIGCALAANFEEFEHFLFFDDLVVWVEFHFVKHACLRPVTGHFFNDLFALNLLKKRPHNQIIVKRFKIIGTGQKVVEHLNAQVFI
jgi:hypothetical protein